MIAARNDVATVPFGTVVDVIVTADPRHGTANNSKRGRAQDFMRHVDMTAFLPTDYKSAATVESEYKVDGIRLTLIFSQVAESGLR